MTESRREREQNKSSAYSVENYVIYEYETVAKCRQTELFCKKNLIIRYLTKSNMPDGFSETTEFENLSLVMKIAEDFGGVLIKTNVDVLHASHTKEINYE